MVNIIEMMQKAKKIKDEMQRVEKELSKTEITGTAAKGEVSVVINGKNEVVKINIADSLFTPDNKESTMRYLIKAFDDANSQLEKVRKEKMKGVTGGLSIPGLF